ncbi:MAG: acetate/propionate family kinase [Clostridia bacterium]|nr:acetate/propionate family kinase [Clostridia bacterium]
MKILICNAGSTSLKFKLWKMPEFEVLATSYVEKVGSVDAIFSYGSGAGKVRREGLNIPDYTSGIRMFLDELSVSELKAIDSLDEIAAVGYKTVLSKDHYGVHELTEDVLEGMRAYFTVAPAHNGPYLEAISVFKKLLPEVKQVGVFETAFHQTIPMERRVFPIPYEWTEKYGILRMGYHGASHGYIAEKLKDYRRVVSCHLGGSTSLCAILDGKSQDNSFGFSLQMGVPHASRTGDVDVYIVPYLLEKGLSIEEIYHGLGKNGGLKGISGTSGDMRDIEAAIEAGSERAELALKVYATHILRYIGAYSMEIGGLDAVAFTGGIGENCVRLRRMVLEGMAHLGLKIDAESNERGSGERRLTSDDSAVAAFVIPANEEYMVVRETFKLCE